jgi:hypothetical protein
MDKPIKKPYQKPEIIHETKLEVRAGTPIGPTGIGPQYPDYYDIEE